MNPRQFLAAASLGALVTVASPGCHRHEPATAPESTAAHAEAAETDHASAHEHDHDHAEHGHEAHEPPGDDAVSGTAYHPDRGLSLTEETRKSLGLAVTEVTERRLPRFLPLTVQIFGEQHRPGLNLADHGGCDAHGAGYLPLDATGRVSVGMPVRLTSAGGKTFAGVLLGIHPAPALGEAEAVVGISNAAVVLAPGEFLPARILGSDTEPVPTVPRESVLRSASGTFVYRVHDNDFLRTPVTLGTEADDHVEVTRGLRAGDVIARTGVETLWLIELRATKGGGHSH